MVGSDAHDSGVSSCDDGGCVVELARVSQMEGVMTSLPLSALRLFEVCVVGSSGQGTKHGNQGLTF